MIQSSTAETGGALVGESANAQSSGWELNPILVHLLVCWWGG